MIRQSVHMRANGRSKYGNKTTMMLGQSFSSKREALAYCGLRADEKAGKISNLRTQPVYELHAATPNGPKKVCTYIADFDFIEDGKLVVADAKGLKTPVYRLKKRWMLIEHGIEVREL